MTTKPIGGPAFPGIAKNGMVHISDGMTLRQWYAGMALQGLMNGHVLEWDYLAGYSRTPSLQDSAKATADAAFLYADAMIAEGEK